MTKRTDQLVQRAVKAHAKGVSTREIARQCRVSQSAILRWLEYAGVTRRPSGFALTPTPPGFAADYLGGMSKFKLAEKYDFGPKVVRRMAREIDSAQQPT